MNRYIYAHLTYIDSIILPLYLKKFKIDNNDLVLDSRVVGFPVLGTILSFRASKLAIIDTSEIQ